LIRRGFSAAFFAAAYLCACAGEPAPIERRISAHSLFGCKVSNTANLVVTPLGDFGGAPATSVADATGLTPIDLRQDFLGIELKISEEWSGIGYSDPPADVDVALWPADDACSATDAILPASHGGMAVGTFGNGKGLLVAGLEPAGDKNDSFSALALDLTTGKTLPGVSKMVEGRAFATATPFGDGVLVAGGVDPSDVTDPNELRPVTTAFVFDGQSFEPLRIDLGNRARARHGATTLASGETLLVGGTIEGVVLPTMVAVDPATRNTRVFGLGALAQARKDPTVLRLANDQILVGGGSDENDNPVATLEWFSPDGSSCASPTCPDANSSLPPRPDLALVALAAGGALAAGALPSADVFDVWWITPEGTAEALEPLARPRRDGKARLVSASDGAPWAWNGAAWLRFDPWQARFLPASNAPLDGPDDDMPSPLTVDPGLFAWLARDAAGKTSVRGFRHDVRGRLSREAAPLLFADTNHVAPDRPPRPDVVSFDELGLHLTKPFTAEAPRVVVTDTLYGDFDLSAEWDPSGVLPEIEIGSLAVGSAFCVWPAAATGTSFSITRRGTTLGIEVGSASTSCKGPGGRVGIGLRAPEFGNATVRKLTIARQ
jgi:hypothetical protein